MYNVIGNQDRIKASPNIYARVEENDSVFLEKEIYWKLRRSSAEYVFASGVVNCLFQQLLAPLKPGSER